jgi:CRP/FNR family cyclic AMP-dependent transcriptional regulator
MSFFDYPTGAEPDIRPRADYMLPDATDDDWSALLDHTRAVHVAAGATVITPGSGDRSLYLVVDGTLEVLLGEGRRSRRVAVLGGGTVIGEVAFFDGGARSATIRAITPADLAELSRARFDALAADRPDLARSLLFELGRILAGRLRAAQQATSSAGIV